MRLLSFLCCISTCLILPSAYAQGGWSPGFYVGAYGGSATYLGEANTSFDIPVDLSFAAFELGYREPNGGAVLVRGAFHNFNAFDDEPESDLVSGVIGDGEASPYVIRDPDWFSASLLVRGGSSVPSSFYPFLELGGTVFVSDSEDEFGDSQTNIAYGPLLGFGFALSIQQRAELTVTASAALLLPDDGFDSLREGVDEDDAGESEGAGAFVFDIAGSLAAGVRFYF